MESTPRPTLDVENLSLPYSVQKERKRVIKRILKLYISSKDRHDMRVVLRKYQRRQDRLLRGYESDPDPYDSDYVFYCLEACVQT